MFARAHASARISQDEITEAIDQDRPEKASSNIGGDDPPVGLDEPLVAAGAADGVDASAQLTREEVGEIAEVPNWIEPPPSFCSMCAEGSPALGPCAPKT